MSNKIESLNEDLAVHQKLDDEPNDVGGLSSEELKALFDSAPLAIQRYINEVLVRAINGMDADMAALAKQLSDHVDVDPNNLTAENVSILRELADRYGLTDKLVPTVQDALEVLSRWAALKDETANRIGAEDGAVLDDAIFALTQSRLSSFSGGLLITATYETTGRPAANVYFTGLPDADPELCRTDENGEFFAEVLPGEYELTFATMIGQAPLADQLVTVEQRKIARVELVVEKSNGLAVIETSGDYAVGEDAATMKLRAVGGGGSGAAMDHGSTSSHTSFALSGGGGGFISELEIDLTGYVNTRLQITVGAGGTSVSCTAKSSSAYDLAQGNQGGSTSVVDADGTVLLSASGGGGGEYVRGTESNYGGISTTSEAAGGAGQCQGVSVKSTHRANGNTSGRMYTAYAVFTGDDSGGVLVTEGTAAVTVSKGGAAAAANLSLAMDNAPYFEASEAGAQPDETGIGYGGAGIAGEDVTATIPGCAGAVLISFAEV